MKRQIHAYRGHDEIAVEGHNIKLGRGGIREIEFFVQTQQLIAGGRHPELRERETLATLQILADGGWIDAEARADLDAAYRFLRVVENRLQMVADEQTHTLPAEREGLERFARFAGFADRDAFAEVLLGHLRNVQRHYATLFENAPAIEAGRHPLSFPVDADDRETLDRLTEMGFRHPLEVSALVRGWSSETYRALRGSFARGELAELVPRPAASIRAFGQSGRRAARLRPVPRRHAGRPAVFAAAAESRPHRADRAGARHRAAARRQPRALSRGDGRGDRSELLRRAARRRRN